MTTGLARPSPCLILPWLALGAAAGCLAAVVAHHTLLTAAARWLDVGESPHAVDFVMVLPGDAETRPFVAAVMVRQGLAKGVLIPRTATSPEVDDGIIVPADELVRRILTARGVADEQIHVLPGQSTST